MTDHSEKNQSFTDRASSAEIALIGIGCMFPKADNLDAYWANIRDGVDAITEVPESHWSPDDYFDQDPKSPDKTYAHRGGFINPYAFNPLEYGISPNNIEATDTTQLLGMVAAKQALADAGYGDDGKSFDRDRVSVLMGVTGTLELVIPLGARLGHPIWRKALKEAGIDDETAEDVVERISSSYVPWQENSFPGLLGNVAAGRIANRLDLGGTNSVCDAACASSLSAMHLACMELQTGKADMVLTGGLDTFNDIFMYMCFSKTPALSPTGNSKPFDAAADGTILGEGLGIIVAKRLEDAKRDGDRIYAVIKSIGSSSDGKGNAIYAPSSRGQVKALRNAYKMAGIQADSIELIEAHGTGTKVGDAVEITALNEVYSQADTPRQSVALGSVKSMIGHTKAAAGVAGLIKAAMALHHKVLPPTIKVDQPNDAVGPDGPLYVNTEKRPWLKRRKTKRRAAVSAFGFGGSNFHCVLEEYDSTKTLSDFDGRVQIVALSADSKQQLESQFDALDTQNIRDAAWQSRQAFNTNQAHRLTLVLDDNAEKVIANAKRMLATDDATWSTPDGAYYNSSAPDKIGKIGILFPGQGSQYVGMMRDLACAFPQMHSALTSADSTIVDRIYPVPVFTDDARQANEQTLRNTANAQPALGVIDLGVYRVLEHFNIHADALAGHSYGELVALCAAGALDENTFIKLSELRGRLMSQGEGDRGSMLAVSCTIDQVQEIIKTQNLQLVIANHNAPNQVVISGATDQIDLAATALKQLNIRCTKLAVSAAFHSSFVQSAGEQFKEALSQITAAKTNVPVYANVTGELYPDNAVTDLLSQQLTSQVQFVDQIQNMYATGISTFIEAGPGKVLTGLTHAILADRPHHAIAIDASNGKRSNMIDLACALAQLAAIGHNIGLTQWDGDFTPVTSPKPAMTIPISGANYMQPRPSKPPRPQSQSPVPPITPAPPATTPANHPQPAGHLHEGILALQQMQQQAAQIHQKFLEGQQAAQRNIAQLIEQQQYAITGQTPPPVPPVPPVLPAPPSITPPQAVQLPPVEPVQIIEPQVQTQHTPQQTPEPEPQPQPTIAPETSSIFEQTLLETVAEKTGYPIDMLDLSMQLEADLGIDSIKRVEILSAMQEKLPDAPAVKPEDLGSLHTLQQIIDFMTPGSTPTPGTPDSGTTLEQSIPTSGGSGGGAPHFSGPRELQKPLDIQRLIVTPAALTTLDRPSLDLPQGSLICITDDHTPLTTAIAAQLAATGYDSRVISMDASPPADLTMLVILAPADDNNAGTLFEALALAQRSAQALKQNSGSLVSISRLDGRFGFQRDGDAVAGGLAGLTKTASHEWKSVHCKALDVADDFDDVDAQASAIVKELLLAGPLEVGISRDGSETLSLTAQQVPEMGEAPIKPGDTVIVTGGARGVTAEVAAAVAQAWQPSLVLLGRSQSPEPEPDWLSSLEDESSIKQAILSRAESKLSPKELDEQYRQIAMNREMLSNIKRFEQAGATVTYHSVDVRNADDVQRIIASVGQVSGLIHGAGVLADRFIEDKTREQFDSVYSTKVDGALTILSALAEHDLRFIAMFSSSTARFGRKGQVDYAMANEVLNKLAQREARSRKNCRVVSANWGPWDGGMVTPALAKVFAAEGIDVIPLNAGAQYLLQELSQPAKDAPVEVVILGGQSKVVQVEQTTSQATIELQIDLDHHSYLRSHVIDGKAVLPAAMITEYLAHGAMHEHPGLALAGIDDLRILKGVILENGQANLRIVTGEMTMDNGIFAVPVELVGVFVHARATILLADRVGHGESRLTDQTFAPTTMDRDALYTPQMLFHGPDMQGIAAVHGCDENGIAVDYQAAPAPSAWSQPPLRSSWIADPLAIDCAFQMMIIWSRLQRGIGSLPTFAGRYRQFQQSYPKEGGRIIAKVTDQGDHYVRANFEFFDHEGKLIAQIENCECVIDLSLNSAFERNTLEAQAVS